MAARGGRLRSHPGHEAADAGLRPDGLAGGTGGVDRGEVPDVERLRRGRRERVHEGRAADQHRHLLAHGDDRVVGAVVLRVPTLPAATGQG